MLYALALAALLTLSAFFSGSEAALFSLSRTRVRALRERSRAGKMISSQLERPRQLLVTILLGNLIVNISATTVVTALCLQWFGERGVLIAFLFMTIVLLVVGEIVPKVLALHWNERLASFTIFPLSVFHAIVIPVRRPLAWVAEAFIALFQKRLGHSTRSFTTDELIGAIRLGGREGDVGMFEAEVFANVLEFRRIKVREIMTPSIHVIAMPSSASRRDVLNKFLESGFSRLPIYRDSPDHVVGILHIKDLLETAAAPITDWVDRLREPLHVPESSPIGEVYNSLQRRKQHAACVIDEYGSFSGIVTLEDILEELVGEIRDARDAKTSDHQVVHKDQVVALGTMELDEFNDVMDTALKSERSETLAGYVIDEIGRIPREGEVFIIDGLEFLIVSAQPNRIRKIRVERVPDE